MAISTIRFTIATVNYDLPSASEYITNRDYTSVAIKMANGRTIWQVFPIEGDEDANHFQHFTLRWRNLTIAERNILNNVYDLMRAGNVTNVRDPEGATYDVKIDPDSPGLELTGFAVAQTMRYRAAINLIKDEA